jgi:nucleoside 2-deoxyribosyltransferase
MIITLCSSAKLFNRLPAIKEALERQNHTVLLPSMQDFHSDENALAKIQHNLIREHFNKIEKSDAILVVNYEKNGVRGYIGGNTFLEMGLAFHRNLPIFLINDIPDISYREELVAMQPVIIGEDWSRIVGK